MFPFTHIEEYKKVDASLKKNWENFIHSGKPLPVGRNIVVDSWERCRKNELFAGLQEAPKALSSHHLKLSREKNNLFLSIAKPFIKALRAQLNTDGIIVVATNTDGAILESEASVATMRHFENLHFMTGAVWSENLCGTNAIGTAIHTKAPVSIFSAEHYCEGWHHLVCTAAPVNDPFTHETLGVIDLTGKKDLLGAHNFSVVYAMKKMIEQAMEQEIVHKNGHQAYHELLENKQPAIAFTIDGVITRFNAIAQIMFSVREGMNFAHKFHLPVSSRMDKHFKVTLQYASPENKNWEINISPHFIDEQLRGGIAVFKPVNGIPQASSKISSENAEALVAQSPSLTETLDRARHAADFDFPVLISGSTGTGKEKIAQFIYRQSPRHHHPFVAVNCGAIPRDLIASELFGYVPGAFTGADAKGKKGKFELAHKGMLFLDEIAELPLDIQPYLLRVLEEKKVSPLGSDKQIQVDVRVLAATHKNLEEEVQKGNFREDLFYRLHVIELQLADLKERTEDIIPLFLHFIGQHLHYPLHILPEVQKALLQYDWPGNVRELKNTAEFAVFVLNGALQIELRHLPPKIVSYRPGTAAIPGNDTAKSSLFLSGKQQENLIHSILKQTGGNISRAAGLLNISRMTLYRKMKGKKKE